MRVERTAIVLALVLALAGLASSETLRVKIWRANLREGPGRNAPVLTMLDRGTELEVLGKVGGWYLVKVIKSGTNGYIHSTVVEALPEKAAAPTPAPPREPASSPAPAPSLPPQPPKTGPPAKAVPAPKPASPPPAPPPTRRLTLSLLGLVGPTSLDFSESRTFTQFAEEGILDVDSSYGTGFGGDVGLQYLFKKTWGAAVSFSFVRRSGSADFTGQFPHPLYLGRPRQASGSVDGLSYQEAAAHVDGVYAATKGKWTYGVFGGVSFFLKVEADILSLPEYAQSYPFDTVTITSVLIEPRSASAIGFNLGGDLGYRLKKALDVGLRVRFSRGTATLDVSEGNTVEIRAGGLQAGLGVRMRF